MKPLTYRDRLGIFNYSYLAINRNQQGHTNTIVETSSTPS